MKERRIIKSIPLIKILIPLFLGLFSYELFGMEINLKALLAFLFVLISALIIINTSFKKAATTILPTILIVLFLFAFGYGLLGIHEQSVLHDLPKEENIFVLSLENAQKYGENFVVMEFAVQGRQHNNKVQLTTKHYDSLLIPGAKILANVDLQQIKNKGNPGEFNFKNYLRQRHIKYFAWLGEYEYLSHNKNYHYYIWKLKQHILNVYEKGGLTEHNKALMFALASGDKSLITDEQKEVFTNSGIIHVLAVSGLHVGIIYLIISFLVIPLRRQKQLRFVSFIIVSILLIAYAFFTGLGPSVLRAVITFILVDFIVISKKNKLIFNIIILSAVIISVIDPHYPLQMGFWLSYMAVISIIIYMNLFKKLYEKKPNYLKKILDALLVSVSVQPGTLPLVLLWFGQFPKYFLISNILVVPVLGIVMVVNYLYLFVASCGYKGNIGSNILNFIGNYVNMIPAFLGGQDNAIIQSIRISVVMFVCLYLLFAGLTGLLYFKNIKSLKFILIIAIIMVVVNWVTNYRLNLVQELIIFNSYTGVQMVERKGDVCVFYGDSATNVISDYCKLNNTQITKNKKMRDFNFINGKVIQFVNEPNSRMFNLKLERYLILNCILHNMHAIDDSVVEIIIPANTSQFERERIIKWCKTEHRNYYDIKTQGAFKI